jgi:hypothetical protein
VVRLQQSSKELPRVDIWSAETVNETTSAVTTKRHPKVSERFSRSVSARRQLFPKSAPDMSEQQRIAELKEDRKHPVSVRQPMRTAITKTMTRLRTYVAENDPKDAAWGPIQYTYVAKLKPYLESKTAGIEALDQEVLSTYPEDFMAAEHGVEYDKCVDYKLEMESLFEACELYQKQQETLDAANISLITGVAVGVQLWQQL